jgi:hypothetical protein
LLAIHAERYLAGSRWASFVLIVLAPALREGLGLFPLREPCDEVGVTGRDALGLERLGYFGDEL